MDTQNSLSLDGFYPSKLKITEVIEGDNIIIRMKSLTKSCKCPQCHTESSHYHGTYVRHVQDLPILQKNVQLEITAREYCCDNSECPVVTVVESFDGFLDYRSRMTERCADFICTLATETSCEGCARICKALKIKTSGDSVIRLLTKRYEAQPEQVCGNAVGIDDFAFKKRHTYGTIIVDEATHRPVAILEGRDGKALKEWLKQNKHVKIVTRDRANAYASAIQEVLPDAMQIADRFHLHQNLLNAVREAVYSILPTDIKIPCDGESSAEPTVVEDNGSSKKNPNSCG